MYAERKSPRDVTEQGQGNTGSIMGYRLGATAGQGKTFELRGSLTRGFFPDTYRECIFSSLSFPY